MASATDNLHINVVSHNQCRSEFLLNCSRQIVLKRVTDHVIAFAYVRRDLSQEEDQDGRQQWLPEVSISSLEHSRNGRMHITTRSCSLTCCCATPRIFQKHNSSQATFIQKSKLRRRRNERRKNPFLWPISPKSNSQSEESSSQ